MSGVQLPKGVTVYRGSQRFEGEIPAECPELHGVVKAGDEPPAGSPTAEPAAKVFYTPPSAEEADHNA